MSRDPYDDLADAILRAYLPDPVDRLAEAVSAAFRDATAGDGGALGRQLAHADLQARHRELRARMEAKYGGPLEQHFGPLRARGGPGMQGRVWC